jgi:hypothetical protein
MNEKQCSLHGALDRRTQQKRLHSGVSELSGFSNLKNYSWGPLQHGHIRSIIWLKDDDSFSHPPGYRPLLLFVPERALARRPIKLGRTNERTFAGKPLVRRRNLLLLSSSVSAS